MKATEDWLPRYHGLRWIEARLPTTVEPWVKGKEQSLYRPGTSDKDFCERLARVVERYPWRWPRRPIHFITDLHADADALIASLVASGCLRKTGREDKAFGLTEAARRGRLVIGGDCFDKGPSNLRLLRLLRRLLQRGANLRLLAGNHDIRVMLGMRSVGRYRSQSNQHFFVRMGPKAIPLLREIDREYLDRAALKQLPSNRACRGLLYPNEAWQERFPKLAAGVLAPATVEREVGKVIKKIERFDRLCDASGLTAKRVYAAVLQWQKLFLEPRQEFHWFYDRIRLFYRKGSFLFIHAGLDDAVADMIRRKGIGHVNRRFRKQLQSDDLSFYYGPIANSFRTKYRAADHPLTTRGVRCAHDSGIHAVVHGHRNVYHGQRVALRGDLLHFECDTTMDSGSRAREGLEGAGAGVTIIQPEKKIVLGISSDYQHAKRFDPLDLH